MTRQNRRRIAGGALVALTAVLAWLLFVAMPGWYQDPESAEETGQPAATTSAATSAIATTSEIPGRRIAARLFYVNEDGVTLAAREQEVAFSETPSGQARAILDAQLAPVEKPLVSAIPTGTSVRAVFLSGRGEAFVDLSREVMAAHPGGSTAESLTVYTIVHALTVNLPAVTAVQLLVEGQEIDTLAGHVNLRGPLSPSPGWIRSP